MNNFLLKYYLRAIKYYTREYANQFLVVVLLSSIVSGSVFTGFSVRKSLSDANNRRTGEAKYLITSGSRLTGKTLAEKAGSLPGLELTTIYETTGYCQNFATGSSSLDVNFYGIGKDFFSFNGNDTLTIPPGTVAINQTLARHLDIEAGSEIIMRFTEADPLPADAPFSPDEKNAGSKVIKVSRIISEYESGDFSLGVSQVPPNNVFINSSDLLEDDKYINRILVKENSFLNADSVAGIIEALLLPEDMGITVRYSEVTHEGELVSDRIFIDSAVTEKLLENIPGSFPVLTYLANEIKLGGSSTPYSFISGLPAINGSGNEGRGIIINSWLADDLKDAGEGDTLTLTWYNPSGKNLSEISGEFIVDSIISDDSSLSDPLLMPDFPGISGRSSCSSWDAGIPVLLDRIRDKDEDYWNRFGGTPKAFISYSLARELWGNNFGVATAVRFPGSLSQSDIDSALKGKISLSEAGISVSDLKERGNSAASESVDFSTLFLSLGFFIILSCIILLSLSVFMFLNLRKKQVRLLFFTGFTGKRISSILFGEVSIISAAGAFAGSFLGYAVNILLIKALNSVWIGAVQITSLNAHFSILPLLYSFGGTLIITISVSALVLRNFLKSLMAGSKSYSGKAPFRIGLPIVLTLAVLNAAFSVFVFSSREAPMPVYFMGGLLLFVSLILLLRFFHTGYTGRNRQLSAGSLSSRFYLWHPSFLLTPVIFISAGIFAIAITGSNRKVINEGMYSNDGGTGGYMFWAESALPVTDNLKLAEKKSVYGLDEAGLEDMTIMQVKKITGDDASCLNLNYISAPPLLGIDPDELEKRGSFSFATTLSKGDKNTNPWSMLRESPGTNIIYGFADQTVLQWGLKLKTGDTLTYLPETGEPLRIIIAGGLKSSIFQGHVLIGNEFADEFFPSVPGSNVFLVDGNEGKREVYRNTLNDRFSGFGLSVIPAGEKLASFFVVTNTYLDVFAILGIFGLVLGVAGMGFILLRTYEKREGEFALMLAAGYPPSSIRRLILNDQFLILGYGIISGIASALYVTWPSISKGAEFPYFRILFMVIALIITGSTAIYAAIRRIRHSRLVSSLRRE